MLPAADAPQLRILVEPFQQLPGEVETIDGLSYEGTGDRQAIFGRPSDPSVGGRHKAGQRDHFQHGHQTAGGVVQFSDGLFDGWKELVLQDVGELRELLAKSKLHQGLPEWAVCLETTAYSSGALFPNKISSFRFISIAYPNFASGSRDCNWQCRECSYRALTRSLMSKRTTDTAAATGAAVPL